ncbi:MAG: hypothetical protein ABL886_05630 [Rhodoglobus sp.]
MNAHVVRSIRGDVEDLVRSGLRDADLVELRAAGSTTEKSLVKGFRTSTPHAYSVICGQWCIAMFGVVPLPSYERFGVVWLLGTDELFQHRGAFLRQSRHYLDLLSRRFDAVGNAVHYQNSVHIRWLEWLGFTFLGRRGPFIEFARITPCANQQR